MQLPQKSAPYEGEYTIVNGTRFYTIMPIGKGHLESFLPSEPREPDPVSIHDLGIYKTHPQNPSRSPAWRWLRAGMLQKRTVPKFRPWDDDLVRSALELRRRTASDDPLVCATAAAEWPDLHAAMVIFESDGPLRWELEARVLAKESHLVIADKIAQPVEVVDAYVNLVYDIESRLHRESFIHNHVISSYQDCWDLGTLWKYYAYVRGPHMIDSLVAVLHPETGTVPEIDVHNLSTLTDEELSCHVQYTGRQVSAAKKPRQFLALDILYRHFDRGRPRFAPPHPTAQQLEEQLAGSREQTMQMIAPRIPAARTNKKAM